MRHELNEIIIQAHIHANTHLYKHMQTVIESNSSSFEILRVYSILINIVLL